MKLAEALMERKAVKAKMEELRRRIFQNAQVEAGSTPTEDPVALLSDLIAETRRFEELVGRINKTNGSATLPDGTQLGAAVIRKDMLRYLHQTLTTLAEKAMPSQDRYSQREIKNAPAVSLTEIHHRVDAVAKELRLLDATVQQANWQTDLL